MKKISTVKYVIALGNNIFEHTMRTRRKDCLYGWMRESNLTWEDDKADGYRIVRIRISEEP